MLGEISFKRIGIATGLIIGSIFLLMVVGVIGACFINFDREDGLVFKAAKSPDGKQEALLIRRVGGISVADSHSWSALFVGRSLSKWVLLNAGHIALNYNGDLNFHWESNSELFVSCPDCGPCNKPWDVKDHIGDIKIIYSLNDESEKIPAGKWLAETSKDYLDFDGCQGSYFRFDHEGKFKKIDIYCVGNLLRFMEPNYDDLGNKYVPKRGEPSGLYEATLYDFKVENNKLRLTKFRKKSKTTVYLRQ